MKTAKTSEPRNYEVLTYHNEKDLKTERAASTSSYLTKKQVDEILKANKKKPEYEIIIVKQAGKKVDLKKYKIVETNLSVNNYKWLEKAIATLKKANELGKQIERLQKEQVKLEDSVDNRIEKLFNDLSTSRTNIDQKLYNACVKLAKYDSRIEEAIGYFSESK